MDLQILLFIQEYFRNPLFDAVMPFLSLIGEGGIIWILVSVPLIISKKYRKYGIMMLIAMLLGFLTGEMVLKNIVCRVRPCNAFPIENMLVSCPQSFSFPSGHSCASFASACIIFIADKRLGVPAFVLAVLIAFSRMYNYVHYPTDVLAGIALGVICALLTYFIYKKFIYGKKREVKKN